MATKLPRIHVPILKPEDVIPHLGSPTHWKQGRSAKAVADSWFRANDLPRSVRAVVDQAPEFRDAQLVDAWLERCVDLRTPGRPSQTDLMAVLRIDGGLGILAVEAKVDESFGETVGEWLADDSDGKRVRLADLAAKFGLNPSACTDLRYQFFHRAASAVLEAQRYRVSHAIMLVQSFCPNNSGFADFRTFFEAAGFAQLAIGQLSEPRSIDGVSLRIGWARDTPAPGYAARRMSVQQLTDFGRTRLSKSFFMRDFLFSDIAAVHGLQNVPDDPELAIAAGTRLCEELLEPLQEAFGRIAIRSAYRSREVNALGNALQAKGKKGYNCASNEANAAAHIWDMRDADGCMGAMACVVVPGFYDRRQEEGDWQKLAWWIHDHLPYSTLHFYPVYWAFNIGWHERPRRAINSYAAPAGCLTKPGMTNHAGSHEHLWGSLARE